MPVESQRNPYSIFDPRRYLSPDQGVNFRINAPAPPIAVAQSDPAVEDYMAEGVPVVRSAPGYTPAAVPPLAGTDMPAELRTPDAPRVAQVNATAGGPSWDNLRASLGQGSRPAVPQIFNQGVEQNPLARPDDIPRRESQAWDLYNASTLGSPAEVMARRNEIIGRHNLNRQLENEYYNMGRGMYTIPRAENVGRFGLDPAQGGGTEGRLAGAAETTAGAHQIHSMTEAAKAEYAMSSAAARQRFMERFPHATPAQLNELVAGEEARGGFAPTTLRFVGGTAVRGGLPQIGGQPVPSATFPIQAASVSAPVAGAAPIPVSNLLETGNATPAFASLADRAVPRPASGQPAVGPGAFMMQLARSSPQIFATAANREALRPYLESRFGRDAVAQAAQGTRSLGGLSWSPASERLAQGGSVGALAQGAMAVPGGAGLAGYLGRLSGAQQLGPTRLIPQVAGQTAPGWLSRTASGARFLGGRALGAPLAILDAALASPAATEMIRSGFGGMTPEQEGRAILEAALNRNQF